MKPYHITPASTPGELRLEFLPEATLSEIQRGAALAGTFKARSLKRAAAWIFIPTRLARWELLFNAGFEPFVTSFGMTRYRRHEGESKRLRYAMEEARAPKLVEVE